MVIVVIGYEVFNFISMLLRLAAHFVAGVASFFACAGVNDKEFYQSLAAFTDSNTREEEIDALKLTMKCGISDEVRVQSQNAHHKL